MKLRFAVLAVLMLFAMSLTAATHQTAKITLTKPTMVAGAVLTPGEYTISWSGTGNDVPVAFMQGKNTVATATARTVNERSGLGEPQLTSDDEGNKARTLKSIALPKVTLELQGGSGTSASR